MTMIRHVAGIRIFHRILSRLTFVFTELLPLLCTVFQYIIIYLYIIILPQKREINAHITRYYAKSMENGGKWLKTARKQLTNPTGIIKYVE